MISKNIFRGLATCLCLLSLNVVGLAQERKGGLELELGGLNGFALEYQFAPKWTGRIYAGATASIGGVGGQVFFSGFVPTLGLDTRWYYGKRGREQWGAYASLRLNSGFEHLRFWSQAIHTTEYQMTLTAGLGWGYRWRLSDKLGLKFALGFDVLAKWYDGKHFEGAEGHFPLSGDIGLTYRF